MQKSRQKDTKVAFLVKNDKKVTRCIHILFNIRLSRRNHDFIFTF